MDYIRLLNSIKKLVYNGGTNDINTRHNKAMAHINHMNLHQDRFQSQQDFRDQYLALKKVCDMQQLCFRMCKDDAWAVLKEKDVTNLMEAQLKKGI